VVIVVRGGSVLSVGSGCWLLL